MTNFKEIKSTIQKVFPYSERSLQSFNQIQLNTLINEALKSDEPYLSLNDTAEKIGLTRETLTKKAQENKVPAFRFNNRWFFKLSLIEKYIPNDWQYEYNRQQILNVIAEKTIEKYSKQDKHNERSCNILLGFIEGKSLETIAQDYGLTKERIRQIIYKVSNRIVADVFYENKEAIKEKESLIKRNANLKRQNLELKAGIIKRHKEQNTQALEQDCNIEDINLSVRAYNALKAAKINTFLELKSYDSNQLLRFRNVGRRTVREVENILENPENYIQK